MKEQVNFDLERMKKAVEGPFIRLPSGLTREQRRTWVKEKLKELGK